MTITLNKEGYEPFIDFLKGWAIICVVITHAITPTIHDASLFFLWGDWAVPLFLLVQVFHTYKKGQPSLRLSWTKMIRRIFLPFAAITFVMFVVECLLSHDLNDIFGIIKNMLCSGGIGPGSYYPWIYLQFFIILPILYKTLNNSKLNGGGYLIIAILLELISSVIDIPHWIYRLLFFRYFFLIYLGYRWVINGIVINWKTVVLSIVSIVAIVFFNFSDYDLSPLFFRSGRIFHWICYFYPATVLVYLIKKLYDILPEKLVKFTNKCGRYSYEIFLWQMFVFSFVVTVINKVEELLNIPNIYHLLSLFNLLASIVISVCFPLIYNNVKQKVTAKRYGLH